MTCFRQVTGWVVLAMVMFATASCSSFETGYFENKVNEATLEMVVERYGPPHREEKIENGKTMWTYYERGSGTVGYTGMGRSDHCRAYLLTFDEQKILREWKLEKCH